MMEVAGLEHCAGNLTDEQKSRIIAAYAQYKLAADLADEALAVYAATEKEDDKLAYVRALAELLDNEKIIIDVLNAFLEVDHDR
jgi:3-hydroxyacyl-CoA dehydrogenase